MMESSFEEILNHKEKKDHMEKAPVYKWHYRNVRLPITLRKNGLIRNRLLFV